MTIQTILKEKNLSRYALSKASGIPWATLSDICSGKTSLERCSATTLNKLSKALDIPMEELILMKAEPERKNGIPAEKTFLEKDLPNSIRTAIDELIEGEKKQVLHLDCLWGELYGAINASQWDFSITKEQADYLRKKYLFQTDGEEEIHD